MPIVNGVYVAPDWQDDQAPALDAAELSAMSGTLEKMDSQFPIAYIETGTYIGTGITFSNTKEEVTYTLSFTKKPKIVNVYSFRVFSGFDSAHPFMSVFVNNGEIVVFAPTVTSSTNTDRYIVPTLSEDGLTLSWYMMHVYSDGEKTFFPLLNTAGTEYGYTVVY